MNRAGARTPPNLYQKLPNFYEKYCDEKQMYLGRQDAKEVVFKSGWRFFSYLFSIRSVPRSTEGGQETSALWETADLSLDPASCDLRDVTFPPLSFHPIRQRCCHLLHQLRRPVALSIVVAHLSHMLHQRLLENTEQFKGRNCVLTVSVSLAPKQRTSCVICSQ